jgi:DNA-binding NarL/FixJ family response regulator
MHIIQLALIEDDTLVQESLSSFFKGIENMECILIAPSVEDFLNNCSTLTAEPEILLLDINLLGMSGIKGIPLLKERLPHLEIIMLTTFEDSDSIFEALCAGACSYLSKKTPLAKIQEAIEIVHAGGSFMSPSIARKIADHYLPKPVIKNMLSPRELEVVQEIVAGKSYKMVAANLFVSINTVRTHIKNIYKILEINSKAELIRRAFDDKI